MARKSVKGSQVVKEFVMNIGVIDVAAESGGALSVLLDFLNFLENSPIASEHNWYVFTSFTLDVKRSHIINIVCKEVKQSWLKRFEWDNFIAKKHFKEFGIDIIFSLQNTGFRKLGIPQIVYFHNVLLLEDKRKYSFFRKTEMKYAIYTHFIAPYTLRSLNYATAVVTQTNVVKEGIEKRTKVRNILVIRPNVNIQTDGYETYSNQVKGLIYPAAPVPFKQFEELVECVRRNEEWFRINNFEVLITIKGDENTYASSIAEKAAGVEPITLIGYQTRISILSSYKSHALFINSEMESFPLPFIEAEYYGSPIIAGSYDYAADILATYSNAEFFSAHNTSEMFSAIQRAAQKRIIGPNKSVVGINSWQEVVTLILNRKDIIH